MTRSDIERGAGERKRAYGFGAITLFFVSPLVAWLPTLATGTGWSQGLYLLGGILVGLGVGMVLRERTRRPWVWQLLMFLMISLAAASLGYATARPNPARLFTRIFKVPPLEGVTFLSSRLQWYDGQVALLRFHAEPSVVDDLVNRSKLVPDQMFNEAATVEQHERIDGTFWAAPIADAGWRSTIVFQSARVFETPSSSVGAGSAGVSDEENVRLLVNESGDVWVMYNQH